MKLTYLKKLSIWEHLSQTEKEMIISTAYSRSFKAGEMIFTPGENCLGIMVVTSGVIRSFLVSEDGRRATVLRLRESDVCVSTMSCVLTEIDYELNFEAESDCSILIVPAATFKMLVEKNLYIENFAYKIVAQRVSYVMNATEQLLFSSLEKRLITFLLDESSMLGSDDIHLTKEQIAENIGSARAAVSRALTKLSNDGLVSVKRGFIRLENKTALYERT